MIEWVNNHVFILLLAAATIAAYFWLQRFRKLLNTNNSILFLVSVLHVAIGVLCVKLFAVAETGFDQASVGNMSLFGAAFFLPLFFLIDAKIFKQEKSKVFDIFCICMLYAVFFSRMNCLFAGCCQGMMIHGLEPHRYPTRELELIFYVVFILIEAPKVYKKETHGEVYPLYMISYGVFRFAIEFLRETNSFGIFHRAHIWAFTCFVLGILFYLHVVRQEKKGPSRTSKKRNTA